MLRAAGLTLLCLTAIALPAKANDHNHVVDGGAAAAQQGATTIAMRGAKGEQPGPTQVADAWPRAQPTARRGSVGGFRRELANQPVGSASLLPQGPEQQDPVAFTWLRQGRSGLAVALTERFRLAVGYRHLEGEDLWPEFADTGAAGYDSHHLLIRASWRF